MTAAATWNVYQARSRRPRGAMDPVDPRGQPQRPDLAIRVFLTGIFPLVFAVTGVIMWWRGRRTRKEVAGRTSTQGELQAAE
jgi:hypothetical protein